MYDDNDAYGEERGGMNLDQTILYWIHDNLSRAARSALSLRRAGKFAFSKLVFDIREKML